MTENVYWLIELAINPGRFEDFKTLLSTMVEATEKDEMGTLNYEWSISDDHRICHIYERYQDSDAVMTHLQAFDIHFAAQFWDAVTPKHLVIYGTPSPQVKEALAVANPVYMTPISGFKR
jgi:quinol monooxygenase YgiN